MNSPAEKTVVVDFDIDHRDLFRVSLSLAKWKLLLGLSVIVIFDCAVIYLFFLLGEYKLLLQLSPLFIGLPLAAFGGQILRLHATARKYVAALPESQRHAQFKFASGSDGIDMKRGESFSHIAWQDVQRISENPAYFLIHQNRFEVGFLPKKGFRPVDIPMFKDIVQSRLGERAQFLDVPS